MADFTNPFGFGDNPSSPASGPGLSQQWSDALNDPTVQRSLLAAGISLLQPPGWGDTTGSQIGRAIGAAGQAQTGALKQDLAQQEADSRAILREAQAGAAEQRARFTGENTDLRGKALDLKSQAMDLQRYIRNQIRHSAAQNTYNKYRELISKENLLAPQGKQQPILPFEEWAAKSGFGDVAYGPNIGGATTSNVNTELMQSMDAIRRGKDINAVRELYRQRTGQPPPF